MLNILRYFHCSVSGYTDTTELARETGCLEAYIKKGIAYACYFLSRCLALGNGLRKDEEEAKNLFNRVKLLVCF